MKGLDRTGFALQDFHDDSRGSSTGDIGMTVDAKTGGIVTLDRRYILSMYSDGKCTYVIGVETFCIESGQEAIYINIYRVKVYIL